MLWYYKAWNGVLDYLTFKKYLWDDHIILLEHCNIIFFLKMLTTEIDWVPRTIKIQNKFILHQVKYYYPIQKRENGKVVP
jgi:hypothetical protein